MNTHFTKEELVDMIYISGEADRNSVLASRIYRQRFPNRRQPSCATFRSLLEKFNRTGSVHYEKHRRVKRVTGENNELAILQSVIENPNISSRKISEQIAISQTSVSKVLRRHKFHPYHIQRVQELNENDFLSRINFCNWAINRNQVENNFFGNLLFTDEAVFHKDGRVNTRNTHYYDTVNPHVTRTMDRQHRWSVNVWAGIVGDHLLGPYFFHENVTGENYSNFLENEFQIFLEDLPINLLQRMWFQHDGAPPHYSHRARNILNGEFPNRWIGRGGTVNWPARSPDLNKMDFFLWGFIKEQVYQDPATTVENMKMRIRNAFASVTDNMLRNVDHSFSRRLDVCIQQNGGHFEQLL